MKEYKPIVPLTDCTNCKACTNICPKEAILSKEDHLGHLSSVIDTSKCIQCNLCFSVCPVVNAIELKRPKHTYAAICNNDAERESSSSGGAASIFAKEVLSRKGTVYGCSQKNYQNIKHIRIDNEADIIKLKGSKYVQSDTGLCFRNIKKDLQNKREVLFIGTPCQVAGLKSYLKKDFSNLYTIDLVCHGVPSQKMLRDEIERYKGKEDNKENIYVDFRWKSAKGIKFGIRFGDSRGLTYQSELPYDPYTLAFYTGISFRECCHSCKYSQENRTGDLTIGDFWKLGSNSPSKLSSQKGVSLILINDEKGESLFQDTKKYFVFEERTLEEAISGNGNLREPSSRPEYKDKFQDTYKDEGIVNACRKSVPLNVFIKIALIEKLNEIQWFKNMYKTIRLYINRIMR